MLVMNIQCIIASCNVPGTKYDTLESYVEILNRRIIVRFIFDYKYHAVRSYVEIINKRKKIFIILKLYFFITDYVR